MEIVKFKTKVYDNILEIIPEDGVKDNSIYTIKLKNIASYKTQEVISKEFKICTRLSPLFVDVQSVQSIIYDMHIPDDVILYHIREASRFAQYIKNGMQIDEDNVPFEVSQFVRYKAAYDCLLRYSINLASSTGEKGQVGLVMFEERQSNKDISKLLDNLGKEIKRWEDEVKGFQLEGRAKMKSTIIAGSRTPGFDPIGIDYGRGV